MPGPWLLPSRSHQDLALESLLKDQSFSYDLLEERPDFLPGSSLLTANPRSWSSLRASIVSPARRPGPCTTHGIRHSKRRQQEGRWEGGRKESWIPFLSKPPSPGLVLSPKENRGPSPLHSEREDIVIFM